MTETEATLVDTQYGNEIVIAIPGKWENKRELTSALLLASVKTKGYTILANILMNAETGSSFKLAVDAPDEHVAQTFEYLNGVKIDAETFKEIEESTAVLYVLAKNTGLEVVKELITAVSDILRVGGLAVRIDTTGIAHSKEAWLELEKNVENVVEVHRHFVTLVDYDTYYSSFGMKSFSYPDVVAPSVTNSEEFISALGSLSFYMVAENPVLNSGETYSNGIEAKFFRMDMKADDRYDNTHIYHNSFGVIHLEAMIEKEEKKKRKLWKKLLSSNKSTDE